MAHDQGDALHRPRRWRLRQGGGCQQPASQEWCLARFGKTFVTKILLQEHFLEVPQTGIALVMATLEQDSPGHLLHTLSALQGEIEIIEHGLARRDGPQGEHLPLVHYRSVLER